jgi:hypothetical protein
LPNGKGGDQALLGPTQGKDGAPGPAQSGAHGAGAQPGTATEDAVSIPKPRFDEINQRARNLAKDNIRLEAERDTLQRLIDSGRITVEGGKTSATFAAAEKTPQEQIAELQAEQRALAKQFSDGAFDADEWEEKRQGIDNRIWDLRSRSQNGANGATPKSPDLYLDEKTAEIEQQFPILQHLTKEQLQPIAKMAIAYMEFEEKPFNANDPRSVLDLRRRVAQMASQKYYLEGEEPAPDGQNNSASGAPATQPTASARPGGGVTPLQRAGKIALAASHPPNLNQSPGGTKGGLPSLTEESLVGMTTEDIAALPPEVLDRIEQQGLP